jgi:hypothetical protein
MYIYWHSSDQQVAGAAPCRPYVALRPVDQEMGCAIMGEMQLLQEAALTEMRRCKIWRQVEYHSVLAHGACFFASLKDACTGLQCIA